MDVPNRTGCYKREGRVVLVLPRGVEATLVRVRGENESKQGDVFLERDGRWAADHQTGAYLRSRKASFARAVRFALTGEQD